MAKNQRKRRRTGEMDAIEMLQAQHRAIERLFADLTSQGSGEPGEVDDQSAEEPGGLDRRVFLELIELIAAHSVIEEKHIYPRARKHDATLADEMRSDHDGIKDLLAHLMDADADDPDFSGKLEELEGLVTAHVQTEEAELFTRLRQDIPQAELDACAHEMISTMVDLQDTGPLGGHGDEERSERY